MLSSRRLASKHKRKARTCARLALYRNLGPVRLRDVDEAQALLVNLAKDLAAKGEIMISKNRADDELVM